MATRKRTRFARRGIALIAAGLSCSLGIALGGCAQFGRWGKAWVETVEPIEAWGSEVVGYEGREY